MAKKGASQTIQRFLALLLILFVPIFIWKEYRVLKPKRKAFSEVTTIEISKDHQDKEKNFVVFVFSSEDTPFCERNLNSLFEQTYDHYKIVFIDSGHNDLHVLAAENLALQQKKREKISFLHVEDKADVWGVFRREVNHCRDEDIIFHLNASDWLAHSKVLETLKDAYKDPEVWLTYCQYLEYPSYKKGIYIPPSNRVSRKQKSVRAPWLLSHAKTYYAGVAKQTLQETTSVPFTSGGELVGLSRLAEEAKWHVRFIPDVLYIHNSQSVRGVGIAKVGEHFTQSLKEQRISKSLEKKNHVSQSKQ